MVLKKIVSGTCPLNDRLLVIIYFYITKLASQFFAASTLLYNVMMSHQMMTDANKTRTDPVRTTYSIWSPRDLISASWVNLKSVKIVFGFTAEIRFCKREVSEGNRKL